MAQAPGGSITEIDKALIVACKFAGQVRNLGLGQYRLAPSRVQNVSKLECETRGGEYVLYDAADPKRALGIWIDLANGGDSNAQNRVGQIYEIGIGLAPDPAEAAKWYAKAAGQGNRAAAINLAALFDRGDGVPKDAAKAAQYYETAQVGTAKSVSAADVKEARQRLAEAQQRRADLEAKVWMAQAAGKLPSEFAGEQKSLDELLAPGDTRPQITAAVMEVGGAAGTRPIITVFDPNVVMTRGSANVPLSSEIKIKDVSGRVRAKNGVADVRINNVAAKTDRYGFFSTSVPVEKAGTRVEIVAVDGKGERETLSFLLQPGARPSGEVTPVPLNVPSSLFGNYYALVIGNHHYRSKEWRELPNSESDARAVADILQKKYGFKRVQLILDGTYEQILNAINDYVKILGKTDNLLIYYAGHGQIDLGTRGYWIPVDGEAERNTKWILNVQITDLLQKSNARKVLVVSDSCYSGAMAAAENGAIPTIRTGLPDEQRVMAAQGMVDAKSRIMLTSGALSPVAEGGGGGHSLFARALLDVLTANMGVLEGYQLFAAVEARVLRMSQDRYRDQTPLYAAIQQAGHEGGDFFFVPSVVR